MVRCPRRLLAVLLLLGLGLGCASAYRQGRTEAEKGNWDVAVARFTKALEGDRNNIRYKLALENARMGASRFHYAEAKKHLAANDLEAAAEALEIAVKYDPANRSASDDLQIVRGRIRKRDEERANRAEFETMKARAQERKPPLPVLSPRSPVPVVIRYTDASLEKILESLGKLAGVNILFDDGYKDKKYSVNLSGVTFQEALDQITFVNRLFYKVLDQNTLIIVTEGRQKRNSYDELMLQTFYLQNAEADETANLIKSIAGITKAMPNKNLGAITLVGTPDQLAWAQRIIEANDKARGEVMIEVQILNVNRTKARQYGLRLSNYEASARFAPQTNDPGDITTVRAHMLSSINLADFLVSIPSTIFAKFLQSEATTRILAAPKLRAAEGKPTELKIGQEVPVPVTTFSTVNTGGSTFAPATSFQYRNVGVTLKITPRVSAAGDITLELTAEFSLLGDSAEVGSSGKLPTFLTRNVTGTVRLRDGETSLIGGLLQQNETDTFTGIFGLQSVPVLNKVFTNRDRKSDETEILISLTPHIVRGPKLTEEDMTPLGVGTQEVPKVEGARPSLFGPEPPPSPAPSPKPATPTAPGAAPPAAPPTAPPATEEPAAPPSAVAAASEARPVTALFSPPEAVLKLGETGSLGLIAVGARDLLSVEVVLTYDPTLVEVADLGPGSLLTLDGQPAGAEKSIEAGRARARFTRPTGTTGSGAVVVIMLKGLKAGSGSLGLDSLVIVRTGGTERPAPPAPARVVVSP